MIKEITDQQLINSLFSTDTEKVISALETISDKGNVMYLEPVFDLLKTCKVPEIEKEILSLLGAVKMKESIPVFMDAIGNEKYKSIQTKLLASCWQNGLRFENYLPDFVDIIINEDWETAFEAFTIIENIEYLPSPEILNLSLDKIRNAPETINQQNRYFLAETLKIIENL